MSYHFSVCFGALHCWISQDHSLEWSVGQFVVLRALENKTLIFSTVHNLLTLLSFGRAAPVHCLGGVLGCCRGVFGCLLIAGCAVITCPW